MKVPRLEPDEVRYCTVPSAVGRLAVVVSVSRLRVDLPVVCHVATAD